MKNRIYQVLIHLLSILAASLTLCFLAFYNHYPLVFNNDTAMYIESGMYGNVAPDRPILYGLFVLGSSLGSSLWGVVIAQAGITALVLYYYFKYLTGVRYFLLGYNMFVLVVSLLMSASFEVSWIMPDIFTPLCILSVGLLVFAPDMKTRDLVIISLLLVFCIGTHNSHLYICICICIVVLTGFMVPVVRSAYLQIGFRFKKMLLIIGLVVSGGISMGSIHYLFTGEFVGSRGGSVFLLSNLIEMGVVNKYLEKHCATENYRICAYKDSLPNNFLWDSNGPLGKMGGWEQNEKEFGTLIKDMVQKPRYLAMIAGQAIVYTMKQLCNYDIVDIAPPGDRVKNIIESGYPPGETDGLLAAKEARNKLQTGFLNFCQNILVGLSLFFYTVVLCYGNYPLKYRLLILFLLLGLVVNAGICSVFSGVFPRYQTRLIWLLPLPVFLFAVQYHAKIRNIWKLPF